MHQAEIELLGTDRLKRRIAADFFQQYFNVGIGTAKAGDGVWDHAKGGNGHKAEPDASDLASACTPGSVHSVGSVVQDDANALQKSTAGRGERDRSFCTNEALA